MAVFNSNKEFEDSTTTNVEEKENVIEVVATEEKTNIYDPDEGKEVTAEGLIARINDMQNFMNSILDAEITPEKFHELIDNAKKTSLMIGIIDFEYKQELIKKELDEKSYSNSIIIDELYSIIESMIDTDFNNDLEMYVTVICCCRWAFWFANEGSVLNSTEEIKAASTVGIMESLASVYLCGYKEHEEAFAGLCNAIAKGDNTLTQAYIGAAKQLAMNNNYAISNIFNVTINNAKEVITNSTGLPGTLFKIVQA